MDCKGLVYLDEKASRIYVNDITHESNSRLVTTDTTRRTRKAQSLMINIASNAYPTIAGGAITQ